MHLLPWLYSLIMIVIALTTPRQGADAMLKAGFDDKLVPGKTLEYIATNKMPAVGGFNFDNWGGVIKYKIDMPVYIDDRADFYGEKFYSEYGTICETRPGWQQLLDLRKITWVLFPKDSNLIKELKERKDWSTACEDDAATLMVKITKN